MLIYFTTYILYHSDLFSTGVWHSNSNKLHSKSQFYVSKPVCNEIFMSIPRLFAPQNLAFGSSNITQVSYLHTQDIHKQHLGNGSTMTKLHCVKIRKLLRDR